MFSLLRLVGLSILIFLAPLLAASAAPAGPVASVRSPDGRIAVELSLDNDGRVHYSVAKDGASLVAPSRLGFLLTDSFNMVRGFELVGSANATRDETWEQPWGERQFVRDHHNELLVKFKQREGLKRQMNVRFRVFDNGIGFRYELPDQPNLKTMRIAEELTEFDVAQEGEAWWMIGGEWNRYEQLYQKTAIDAVSTAHTPITMRLKDGTHLAFHEAALVDYSAMWFKRAEGQRFRSMLSPSSQGPKTVRDTPFETPWRTISIGASAGALVENDIILNLNEPNKLGDVSWVKPYKFAGIWWGMFLGQYSWATGPKHGATTANARKHIDWAASHGITHLLIEGWNTGWDGDWFGHGDDFSFTKATPDFDLKGVAAYAKSKGVRLVGHHETGGNIANYERQMKAGFKLYESLGIDSIKTGYVADAGGIIASGSTRGKARMEWHDGQTQVRHHLKVVTEAAKHRISIDAHEPVKDTGLRRTYPNWVSREGARGIEYNAFGPPNNPAEHESILVFTRMLSGPMDYTPGVLSLKGSENWFASTLAKQLALYVVVYSPIQMIADTPEHLDNYPRELAFIKQVPTDWSETRVLSGEIGEHVVFARKDRNSADWYLGGVTDETARSVSVSLDFLEPGRTYTAAIYRDGDDADYLSEKRHSIAIETRNVRRGDVLALRMAAAGGFAVRLAPQP